MINFLKRKPKPYKDEPCFYSTPQGIVYEGTLRTFSQGELAVFTDPFWQLVNKDGTFKNFTCYRNWWRP